MQDYGLPKLSQSLNGDGNDDESLCSEDLVEESMKVVRLIKTDEPLVSFAVSEIKAISATVAF